MEIVADMDKAGSERSVPWRKIRGVAGVFGYG
jgi:hypothetical protein